jgi:hypothetical protein
MGADKVGLRDIDAVHHHKIVAKPFSLNKLQIQLKTPIIKYPASRSEKPTI